MTTVDVGRILESFAHRDVEIARLKEREAVLIRRVERYEKALEEVKRRTYAPWYNADAQSSMYKMVCNALKEETDSVG